jgi:prepilin-type N-terminal cleavage/methylation domain-containing protein
MPISQAPRWATNRRRAFTLVEVLVVLVVASISLGMVAFALGDTGEGGGVLEAECERLANWIRTATDAAYESGETRLISYDLDGGTLTVLAADGERLVEQAGYQVGGGVRIAQITWVDEEIREATAGTVTVTARPDGTCTPHLVLLATGQDERTLEVNPVTGDVTVFAGRRSYETVSAQSAAP